MQLGRQDASVAARGAVTSAKSVPYLDIDVANA